MRDEGDLSKRAGDDGPVRAFSCRMCGNCCFGEGGITVDPGECERIAGFLEMTAAAFRSGCCEERNGCISIRTGKDGACLFFEKGRGCGIHPVKPRRCALWPFYPALLKDPQAWREAMNACPGINPECSHEEFVRQGKDAGASTVD